MLRFTPHDIERGRGAGRLARADRRAENGLFRMGAEILNHLAGASHETAGAGERFREAAAHEVDLVVQLEVIDRAAPLPAEHAETVGVIKHQETAVLLGRFDDLRQANDMALHRIHALDHDHLRDAVRNGLDDLAQILGIVVGEAFDRGHRQTDAVPHAGMDVLVDEDDVALLREGGDARHAGEVAGNADMAGLAAEEGGQLLLDLVVESPGTVGRAGPGRAGAPAEHGGATGLNHLGMKRQPEVVVARQHDHIPALQRNMRPLLRLGGMVVGRVFQPHLGGIVPAAAFENRLLVAG